MVLSAEANAARARARWAAMTPEEKIGYNERRKKKPSRQPQARMTQRVGEWKKKYGEDWVPRWERPWVGVDGEGGEWEGRHCYGLLTVGDASLMNPDGSPLSSAQCLDFLTAQPKDRRYAIFYGGYDATFFWRDFPVEVQADIVNGKLGADGKRRMVRYGYWWIDYLPRKILKVYRTKDHPDGPGGIVLYDVSAYWQCSFLQALKDWEVGTEEEWEDIRVGKETRSTFTLPCPPEVVRYNLLECRLLASLVDKMVTAAETLGITLRSYHGPATLSTALFEKYGVKEYMDPRAGAW